MAIDPRRLRPSELCRLLNSTPTGEVIGERQLHRHRTRAGLRITSTADPHAMNLKLDRGEAAFWAEYQNEPLPEEHADDDMLTADQIAAKVNGLKRGEVPIGCTHLTMFIDVQGKALFYLIAAWESDFTGFVIDYGTEPDQKAEYFTLRDIRRTLASAASRGGLEGAIYAGLERLTDGTLG